MTPREKLEALLNGRATKEVLQSLDVAVSGAWVGHVTANGEKLYLTTEGAFTVDELADYNETRPGSWQAIDIPAEAEPLRFYTPVQGVGRPVQDATTAHEEFLNHVFGLNED